MGLQVDSGNSKASFNHHSQTILVPIPGIKQNSLIHRFIAAGKPGRCSFCSQRVAKLEAHHTSYSPEAVIKLCHNCHHSVHFWPQRLSIYDKKKLFLTLFDDSKADFMSKRVDLSPQGLSRLIAPSRKLHLQALNSVNFPNKIISQKK